MRPIFTYQYVYWNFLKGVYFYTVLSAIARSAKAVFIGFPQRYGG